MVGLTLPQKGGLAINPSTQITHAYSSSLLDLGYLRDVTGNYTASFVVAGTFLLAGSGVLITLSRFSCFSASTSRPQDLVIEALDTKVPLPMEGLGED